MIRRSEGRLILSILLLSALLFLAGCRGRQEEVVEITLIHGWGSTEADHVAMRRIYQDFEKEHPNIRLNLVSMPSSEEVIIKAEDMLTVGEMPDIIFTGGLGRETVYRFMVENDYAVDIMPYLEADESFGENVSEATLSYWTEEGNRLFTVSDVILMSGYWYNTAIFEEAGIEEPPTDWMEFIDVCRRISQWAESRKEELVPVVLDAEHILHLADAMLADIDPGILEEIRQERIDFSSEEFAQVMEQLKAIYQCSAIMTNYTYRDTLESFNRQESAIYINGVWASSMIDQELKVGYAAFPHSSGKGLSNVSSCVGYILGKSGDSKREEASVEFLKYMLSQPVAKRILTETGQIPSNPRIKIEEGVENERLRQAVSCVKNAEYKIEVPANIWKNSQKADFGESTKMYLTERITLVDFFKRLQKE